MSSPAAEVAADFRDYLQTNLRVNSRAEISTLTVIAKENTEHAQAISSELENHIRTTRPEWKLPALYVLDSIVKNVGTPYTVYLGRNLYRTFMDAYLVVDQATRKAMEGLLRTWKQPVPESMDTRPVFPANVTADIENAVNKIHSVTPQSRPMHPLPPRPTTAAWRGPQQTPEAVSTPSIPPSMPPAVPAPNVLMPQLGGLQHFFANQPPNVLMPQPGGLQQFFGNRPPSVPMPQLGSLQQFFPPPTPAYSVPPPAPPAVNPTVNLAALLAQLSQGGATPAPTPQPAALLAQYDKDSATRTPSGPFSEGWSTRKVDVEKLGYNSKSSQCAQCGRRFEDTAQGKEKKIRHLDWHFRVKDPDARKRGVHRSWYMSEKDWIDYREVDETAPAASTASTASSAKPKKQAKDCYVVGPDVKAQHTPCPICQEKCTLEFNAEENDWVLMDAVKVNGRIFHATCYEEAYGSLPSTPDSVLGKRKADGGMGLEGKKVRAF